MTILEILQNQQASLEKVEAFEKNETPISTVDLYRDKLQLADIFFMDEKYRDSSAVKILMQKFCNWINSEKSKGKNISSCISEAVSEDGIKTFIISFTSAGT